MEVRKHIFEEGESNEKIPEPETDGLHQKEESETEQALKIILGIEDGITPKVQTLSINATKEKSLINRAREFRAEFEAMKGES